MLHFVGMTKLPLGDLAITAPLLLRLASWIQEAIFGKFANTSLCCPHDQLYCCSLYFNLFPHFFFLKYVPHIDFAFDALRIHLFHLKAIISIHSLLILATFFLSLQTLQLAMAKSTIWELYTLSLLVALALPRMHTF